MRYSFILASLLFLNIQSTKAIIMNGEGIDTGHVFIKWEQLAKINSLENQVRILQVCGVLAASIYIYMKWFYKPENHNDNEEDDLKIVSLQNSSF